ncbi:hypothetical protein Acr_02g0004160 [Actinidia rufa]|uniref:X8 domain-containing protein n=1 Tax=Actinidia rufa TaxID=165716 RepID=A0A7J0E7J9_9ERIC|nr:hypothetical protein Acr_02g0004160 [Actinidia rufa]
MRCSLFAPSHSLGAPRARVVPGGSGVKPTPVPAAGKQWCVAKAEATDAALLANINWACTSGGVDCSPIQEGGACFNPNTARSRAGYVMNAYYQAKGHQDFNCDFSNTGFVTASDPSYGTCKYSA